MALLGYPLQPGRETSSQKVYVLRPWKGNIYAQTWPRKRGPRKQDYTREMTAWLPKVVKAYKMVDARVVEATREAAALTRLRPQDRFTSMTAGRQWLLDDPAGGFHYPLRFVYCVSAAIDACCAAAGGMMIRGRDQWRPLPAGAPGSHLTMTGGMPAWSDGTMTDEKSPNTTATTGISQSLDAIGKTPGGIACRGPKWWTIIEPGNDGDILTINQNGWPEWRSQTNR